MAGTLTRGNGSTTSEGITYLKNALKLTGTVAITVMLESPAEPSLPQVRYNPSDQYALQVSSWHDSIPGVYLTHASKGPSWLAAADKALREMTKTKDNWNGYGSEAPNAIARRHAQEVLDVLAQEDFDLAPNVVPSADNGVGISFRNGDRYALIECYNTGEIAAVFSKGPGHAEPWEVAPSELRDTVERFHAYIHGAHSG